MARKKSKKRAVKPGPGRPTTARVESIDRAILVEAQKLFWALGYPDTQMEAVAAKVGISKRTLYDRYPNKVALLTGVLATRAAAWTDIPAAKRKASSPDLQTRLKERAYIAMEYCCSGEYERSVRFWRSCPMVSNMRNVFYEIGHKRTAEIVSQEIAEVAPELTTNPTAAFRLAEMFMNMLFGWWESHLGFRDITREEAWAHADQVVNVLLNGRSSWINE